VRGLEGRAYELIVSREFDLLDLVGIFLHSFISLSYASLPPAPTLVEHNPCGLVLVLVLLLNILFQWVSPRCIVAECFGIVRVSVNLCCEASV